MHRAGARARFLECSLKRAAGASSVDPFFCLSKRESDEVAADRSDRTPGGLSYPQPTSSTAKELGQLNPDPEVILLKPHFVIGKTKIRLCWLFLTIKYDMQKNARREGESSILAISRADTPGAMPPGPNFYTQDVVFI